MHLIQLTSGFVIGARSVRCKPYGTWALSGNDVSKLKASWVHEEGQRTLNGLWTRSSPEPRDKPAYPYSREFEKCGYLRTYEFLFPTASHQLAGADGTRITIAGAGSSQPLQDNGTDDGRALNRRVEILRDR